MNTYGWIEVYIQPFSASALDGGDWPAFSPDYFMSRDTTHNTHWIGNCVGPRASLDSFKQIKNLASHEQNRGRFTHSMPFPCHAKGLECVFPIWFTHWGRVWFTLAMPYPSHAHAMPWQCCSSQGHGTVRPSRDGLWATCLRLASSSYHKEFHEDCYHKHTNPPHNNPYLWL